MFKGIATSGFNAIQAVKKIKQIWNLVMEPKWREVKTFIFHNDGYGLGLDQGRIQAVTSIALGTVRFSDGWNNYFVY